MAVKSELTETIEQLISSGDYSLSKKIGNILKQYSIDGEWLPTIIDKKTNEILTHEVDGKHYIPLFSDDHLVVNKGNSVLVTSINKIIEPLFHQESSLAGIEINPFVHGLCIEKGILLKMIIGEKERLPTEIFDWGKGIPNYDEKDILDEKSILNFGIEIVFNCCKSEKTDFMFFSNDIDACPNVLIKKDGKLAFLLVEAAVAPNIPQLNSEKRQLLSKRAKQFEFDCYYASVSIGSADSKRFESSLALRGDKYYAKFDGLEKVECLRD